MSEDAEPSSLDKLPNTPGKAAEFYAAQFGWRVFPLYEMAAPGVCSCHKGAECPATQQGKHPRVSIPKGEGSVHPATTNLADIRKWWKKWPTANIGVWLEGSNLIVLDIDKNEKKDGFKGLEEIMSYEGKDAMPDTLTCNTPSGGKHLYFRFVEGVPNRANSLGPGIDTWHGGHYVIVPPSNHVKGTYEWASGTETIMAYPDWLKPKDKKLVPTTEGPAKRGRPTKERLDPNDKEDIARLVHALKHVDATNRDIWVSVGFAIARAFDWTDAGFTIYNNWSATAHNYDEKKTAEQYFKQSKTIPATPITTASIFEWAKLHPDYKGLVFEDDREFEIRERPANTLTTLIEMGSVIEHFPIYQRGPKLVEIIPVNSAKAEPGDGVWRPKGSYVLREVQALQLATRILPMKVRWMRMTEKGWRANAVNVALSSAFLGIGNWPLAHKLRAFTQHPTLRDDGTLITKRGFDKQSGLFLTDEIKGVKVKDKATKGDAMKALALLMHPFNEFRWIDGPVSTAAMMTAIFTVGIRHLFDEGVPLFAVDAPRQGSGKSKLVKAISNLWFGRPSAVTPYSSDPEEMKKHLASMLLNGDRVVLFDNVHPMVKVNDPTLNALLTSGRATFRELGTQRMLELDCATTFFMTGNNLKIIGDTIRRTIKMTIDPGGLHPMDRVFKIDPLEAYILKHRPALLSAALTILVAFFNAGCPKPRGISPIASFERWSELIRNLVLWLGLDDVKECISQGYEQDDESMEIEHLLRELYKINQLQVDGLPSSLILPLLENNKALKEAMIPFMSERALTMGMHHPRVINTVLSQVAKIPVDGKRLLRIGSVWVIRSADND